MMNKLYERPPMLLFLSCDLFCERREMLGEMRWLTEDIFLQISDATAQPFPLMQRSSLLPLQPTLGRLLGDIRRPELK